MSPKGAARTGVEGPTPEGRLNKIATVVEIAKNAVQILAIFIAGYWAYHRFDIGERHSIAGRLQVRSQEIDWFNAPDPEFCFGKLEISVRNISKQNVSIDSIKVSVSIAPVPPDQAYIDPKKLTGATVPLDVPPITTGSLIGPLGPDIEMSDAYVFKLRRDPGKIALFSFDAVGTLFNEVETHTWPDWRWAFVCGEREKGEAKKRETEARLRNDELRALIEAALKRLEK